LGKGGLMPIILGFSTFVEGYRQGFVFFGQPFYFLNYTLKSDLIKALYEFTIY